MPDDDDDLDEVETDEDSRVIRDLRAKAKRADDAEKKATDLERENALLKSGLALDDEKQQALLALVPDNTPEAFKAKAVALGWHTEESAAETPQVPAEEQQALQRVQEATAAAQPADGTPEKLEDRLRKAQTPEELRQVAEDAGIAWNETDI